MDSDEILIPFAMCEKCEEFVPVLFREFDFDKETTMEVIACPHCLSLLNFDKDVKLEYYELEEVERLGYKIVEEEGRREEG